MNFYNEIDPFAAYQLRELIALGLIPYGVVDERSIEDIVPSELAQYTQCHFFAGVAGWSRALDLAGWSADRRIWTGSCPCQPFSAAGEGAGFADERHLWPAFHWLIQQCEPELVLGEQVASKFADPWIDLVHADMEALGYAFAGVAFPAAGVGAPHIRDRTYWLADANNARLERRRIDQSERGVERLAWTGSVAGGRNNAPTNGYWSNADWIGCTDGKWRAVAPGSFPLADGIPDRVGFLRAWGNAIVPQQAAQFIVAAGLIDHV